MTNYIAHYDPFLAQLTHVPDLRTAQMRVVAKSGAEYTSIQAAIDSVTDATSVKPYLIKVRAGVYTENVVLKNYVYLQADLNSACIIVGTVTATLTGASGINGVRIQYTPTADGQTAMNISGGNFSLQNIAVLLLGAGDWSVTGIYLSAGTGYTISDSTVSNNMSNASITKDFTGWEFAGAGSYNCTNINVSDRVSASAGERCMFKISGTGSFSQTIGLGNFVNTFAATTCTVHGMHVTSISTQQRSTAQLNLRFTGVSGGTAYGFRLSNGTGAEVQHVGSSVFMTGIDTVAMTDTALNDTQKIWLNSINKDLGVAGAGLSIVTPYHLIQTGFVEWSSVAGNFYSFVPATKRFTVLKRATAIYKSSPVVIAANQFVDLPTDNAAYFIYADSTGTLQVTATPSFSTMILLFSVFSDGTNYAVSKQTHPVSFPADVSSTWHLALGSSLDNNSNGVLTLLSGAGRTLQLVGTTTYRDHGVDTTVADSAGAAISIKMFYTAVAGLAINGAAFTAVPGVRQNGTALANIANGKYVNYRVGVYPSNNLDSTTPNTIAQYAIIPDSVEHLKASAAAAQITANGHVAFPTAMSSGLEVINLGSITIQGNGAGGGTITAVVPGKQVFGVNFASGSTSSAGTVTTDTSAFDKILSATDTNVQTALNTIDENAAKKETGDIALTSFSAANNQAVAANVTGLAFANASVRAFRATVSIAIDATDDLFEVVYLFAVQRTDVGDWALSATSVGDDTGVVFDITAAGQVTYTSTNLAGFVSNTMKYRAWATTV